MRRCAGLLGVALAVAFAAACDDLAPCDEQGDTQPCECAGGAPGAQVCMPERIWSACDCSAPPVPEGGSAGAAGASGAGGSSGTGGQSGASGASGATPPSGGMGGGDDDAGMDPEPGAGAGGGSGAGAGGAGGASGSGGATAPMSAAYGGCTNANDCDEGAMCLMSPPDLFGPLRVCARECGEADDCPVPEGTYDADVTCVGGRCRIDCTEMESFPLPVPQSCPGGMICIADEFPSPTSYCYDDGA